MWRSFCFFVLILPALFLCQVVAIPVSFAGIASIILLPWHVCLSRWFKHREHVSAFLIIVMLLLGVCLPIVTAIFIMSDTLGNMRASGIQDAQHVLAISAHQLFEKISTALTPLGLNISPDMIQQTSLSWLQQGAQFIAHYLATALAQTPRLFLNIFLFLISTYFFLTEHASIHQRLLRILPFHLSENATLLQTIAQAARGVVFGSIVTAVAQSMCFGTTVFFLNIPGASILTAFAFFMSFVPIVGTGPLIAGVLLYCLAIQAFQHALVMLGAGLLIGTIDNMIRPWIQQTQSTMHPLITLLSMISGAAILGASGIFLGPIIASVAIWVIYRL